MVVLIDTNVIMDYLVTREAFFQPALEIMELCARGKIQGYVAFHSISNIFFILRKACSQERRRELLKEVCRMLTVTGASHEGVCRAIERDEFGDFEDCLQDECAKEIHANYIITRNMQDFQYSNIPAIEPHDFLGIFQEI